MITHAFLALAITSVATGRSPDALAAPGSTAPAAPLGDFQGTSTCTDLAAVPGCHDEVVVYEFTPGETGRTVHGKADKVVDGERLTMGEFDLAFDPEPACWQTEVESPRAQFRWCLKVDGSPLTGSAWLLPAKQTFRKIEARKD
jgi:hypothetical protein